MQKTGIRNLTAVICVITFSLLFVSCKQPPSFDRTNKHDPLSYNFKPVKEKGLNYTLQNGTLTLSWSDTSSVVNGFIVEKAIDDSVSFKEVKTLPRNTLSYKDNDISYFYISYRVYPYIVKNGKKHRFNYKELVLNRYKPESLYFNLYLEKNTLVTFTTISSDANFEVDGFELERAGTTYTDSYPDLRKYGHYKLVANIHTLLSGNSQYHDTTLVKNNHLYDYRIRAYNNDGKSLYTYSYCCEAVFNISPPTITGITSLDPNSLVLHWINNSKASGVIIERSEDNTQQYKRLAKFDSISVTYKDSGLDQGKTYYYRVSSLSSEFSKPAKVMYQLGVTESKRLSAFSVLKNVEFRPGTDEFVSTNIISDQIYPTNKHTDLHFWKESGNKPYYDYLFTGSVADLTYKSDGSYLALIFDDGYIRTFKPGDLSTYAYSRIKRDANGTSISLKPNSNIAAVGYADGTILIVDFVSFNAKPAVLERTIKDLNSVSNLSYSPDGKYLVATGDKGTIIEYDVANNYQKVKTLKTGNGRIYSLKISHTNKWIATCDVNNLVNVWSLKNLTSIYSLKYNGFGQYHHPISLAFSRNDSLLFAGSSEDLILEWDMNTGTLSQIKRTRNDNTVEEVVGLDLNTKTDQLLSAGYSDLILWNVTKQWIKKEN